MTYALFATFYYLHQGGGRFYVQDYCKSNESISLKLCVMIGPISRQKWLFFVMIRLRIRIPDYFSTCITIAEQGFSGDLLVGLFLILSPADFHDVRRNDWRRQDNASTVQNIVVSYPADIRILINPEIWIQIPDHFWLRLDVLAEVCALWAQSSCNDNLRVWICGW